MKEIATDWKYQAYDGKMFDNEYECKLHEKMLDNANNNLNSIITIFNSKLEIIEIKDITKIPEFSFLVIHDIEAFKKFVKPFNDDFRNLRYPNTETIYYNNYGYCYDGIYGKDGFEAYCDKDTYKEIERLEKEMESIKKKINFYNEAFNTIIKK